MSLLEKAKEFEKDFSEAVQTLSVLASKYDLPPPALVLGPEWKAPFRSMKVAGTSFSRAPAGLHYFDVNLRFGVFEARNIVFREI